MEKIYSKVKPDILLHIINRKEDICKSRKDLSNEKEFLQIATIPLSNGQTFKPHKHIFKKSESRLVIAQESWIVIQGQVKCILYDLDNQIIAVRVLNQGDCSITFRGGHNYECLQERTLVYEVKTGPYQGQLLDKEMI